MQVKITRQVSEINLSSSFANLYSDSCHISQFPFGIILIYVSFGPSLRLVHDYIHLASIKSPRSELQCADLKQNIIHSIKV